MIAPRRMQTVRRATQVLALLLFLVLFVQTPRFPDSYWATIFQRLDPLTALTASLAGRALVAGFWLAIVTVILTLLFGRVWCGWICPLGTLLEWITPRRHRSSTTNRRSFRLAKPPETWRVVKYVLLLVLLFAALLGNQTLLFLDPITLMMRTMGTAAWPALSHVVYTGESLLYRSRALWNILDVLHGWVVYPLFRDVTAVFHYTVPIFLLAASIVLLNWWAERFWCRYLCPLGALLGLLSKLSLIRREVVEGCQACAICMRGCPTDTIDPQNGFRSDPSECIVCYDCLVDCPEEGIAFRLRRPWRMAAWQPYDPGRRHTMAALGTAVAGLALAGVEPVSQHDPPSLLRPPGVTHSDMTTLCINCGACLRVCPTQGLQVSLLEGGWQNLFTPHLVPRIGYCIYDCQVCSQVCPSGVIPQLPLQEKYATPIGLARIDRNRCLPWAYSTPCIVCEEICPIPDKAIRLEEAEVVDEHGDILMVQRPSIIKELCVGCGFCEYKCPMGGEAAIRIFAQPVANA